MDKVYTKEDILAYLDEMNGLERAVVAIYKKQTDQEKAVGVTQEDNGVGFNGADSAKMSYYARWIISGRLLTGEFRQDARKRIRKYAGQLVRIANKEL